MKKSLLAVAALGAFASAAQAQSSVTVYGILDVGYLSQSTRQSGIPQTTGGASGGAGSAGANNSIGATAAGFGSSAEQTSRLGIKGSEDMGGGTSAFFTVEFGLTPTDSQSIGGGGSIAGTAGSGGGNGNSQGAGLNNRQSFAGIKKNGIGAFSIGTQYTPMHEGVAITDPGMQNNMPGNLIYVSDLSVNSYGNQFTAANAPNNGNFGAAPTVGGPGGGGGAAYIVRSGNSLKFVSDPYAGVVAKLMYAQSNSNTNTTTPAAGTNVTANSGGTINNTLTAVGLEWTWNKLVAVADYTQAKAQTYASQVTVNGINTTAPAGSYNAQTPAGLFQVQGTAVPAGTTWGAGSTAQNILENNQYLGAVYDFGILKGYVNYVARKASATYDSNVFMKRTAQQIGVRSFVTPQIEAWASGATGKVTNSYYSPPAIGGAQNGGTNSVGANVTAFQLGSNYWLSKRTNLYAIYGITKTGNAVYPNSTTGNTATINANSSAISAYAVGMRHTF